MGDPYKVVIVGPLAPLATGFHTYLTTLGYSPDSTSNQLQLIAHLSRWMDMQGLSIRELSDHVINAFFAERRLRYHNFHTSRALAAFTGFLRSIGVERTADLPPTFSAQEAILSLFEHYLVTERALRGTTVLNYLNQVRPFLVWRVGHDGSDWASMSIVNVTDYLLFRGATQSVGSIRLAATALRAFFRWLFLERIIDQPVAEGIGPVAYSPYQRLPKFLNTAQIDALLAGPSAREVQPLRSQALLLIMVRMGLRAREVQDLTLDDIDWHSGTIRVLGKAGHVELVPLPIDAGAAIVDYLTQTRPASPDRHIFLQVPAPHGPLARGPISQMVTVRASRTDIGSRIGAHRLRHSLATKVLDSGGTLTEASQILRHSSPSTTVIYAKVHLADLRSLVKPWPVAAEQESLGSRP
ncbi:tyrosine-type recombinase/integrase [Glutamicibacter ardleyensis]|uniref:tyrosine-type recombinase/integrase n=1 Tax=Glutamicibacter ardleyensis TaxID=225894 RepID=UPI003F9094CB